MKSVQIPAVICLAIFGMCDAATAQTPDTPAPSAAKPAWVTVKVPAPRVSFHTFESAAAKSPVSYHMYTPAAYNSQPERRFPVVYWLHGSGGGLAGIPQVARRFDASI